MTNTRRPNHPTDLSAEDLLSAEELAEYLQIPIDTLYAWRYKHYGPPGMRVGRHLRYRFRDIEAWLDGQAS